MTICNSSHFGKAFISALIYNSLGGKACLYRTPALLCTAYLHGAMYVGSYLKAAHVRWWLQSLTTMTIEYGYLRSYMSLSTYPAAKHDLHLHQLRSYVDCNFLAQMYEFYHPIPISLLHSRRLACIAYEYYYYYYYHNPITLHLFRHMSANMTLTCTCTLA